MQCISSPAVSGAMRRAIGGAAILAGLAWQGVQGQPSGTVAGSDAATLVGTVQDTDGRPLSWAEVHLLDLKITARTTGDGQFVIHGLPAGAHLLHVWSPGFDPVQARLNLHGGDSITVAVTLEPGNGGYEVTRQLEETTPEAFTVAAKRRAEFAKRRDRGHGWFLTSEQIDPRATPTLADVLAGAPGVGIADEADGYAKLAPHGIKRFIPGRGCVPVTLMDGFVAIVTTGQLRSVPAANIEAIEVYRGTRETPREFAIGGQTCGAIVVWTRQPTPTTTVQRSH